MRSYTTLFGEPNVKWAAGELKMRVEQIVADDTDHRPELVWKYWKIFLPASIPSRLTKGVEKEESKKKRVTSTD